MVFRVARKATLGVNPKATSEATSSAVRRVNWTAIRHAIAGVSQRMTRRVTRAVARHASRSASAREIRIMTCGVVRRAVRGTLCQSSWRRRHTAAVCGCGLPSSDTWCDIGRRLLTLVGMYDCHTPGHDAGDRAESPHLDHTFIRPEDGRDRGRRSLRHPQRNLVPSSGSSHLR